MPDKPGRWGRRPPRRWRALLADPGVIGWPLLTSSFALFLLDGFPTFLGTPIDGGTAGDVVVVCASAIAAQLALTAVLLLGRATVLRVPRLRRACTMLALFTLGACAAWLAGHQVALAIDPATASALTTFAVAVPYEVVALAIIAVIIGSLLEHRATVARLLIAQERLEATKAAAGAALAHERERVVGQVRSTLRSAIAALPTLPPAEAADLVRDAAAEVVRPLSHRLAAEAPAFQPPSAASRRPPPWRDTLAEVTSTPLLHPLAMALTTLVLATRLTISAPPPAMTPGSGVAVTVDLTGFLQSLGVLAVAFASVWLLGALAKRIVAARSLAMSSRGRWAVTALAIAAVAALTPLLIAGAYAAGQLGPAPSISWTTRVLFAVPLLIVTLVVAIVRTVRVRREQVTQSIAQANADLAWQVARINEELWERRQRLSAYLHGPVQAALNAAHLRHATGAGAAEPVDSLIATLRELDAGLDGIALGERQPVAIDDEMQLIRRTWQRLAEFTWWVDPDVREQLADDDATGALIAHLAGEACANAAVHGGASHVRARVQPGDDRSVVLEVVDDGALATFEPGLGMRMLDDVSLSWSLDSTADGVVLRAELPMLGRAGAWSRPAHRAAHRGADVP